MQTLCILICPVEINHSRVSVAGLASQPRSLKRWKGSVSAEFYVSRRRKVLIATEASRGTFVSPSTKVPNTPSQGECKLRRCTQAAGLLARGSLARAGRTTRELACDSPAGKSRVSAKSVTALRKLGCSLGGRNSGPFCSLNAENTSVPESAFSERGSNSLLFLTLSLSGLENIRQT